MEYADINFSLLKRNGAREAARRQECTKTVYAEIKKAVEEREDDAEEEGEMLEAKEDEMVVEMEMKYREPEKELKMGKERVYATVNDVTDEIWGMFYCGVDWDKESLITRYEHHAFTYNSRNYANIHLPKYVCV